jgi:hypothetical protein
MSGLTTLADLDDDLDNNPMPSPTPPALVEPEPPKPIEIVPPHPDDVLPDITDLPAPDPESDPVDSVDPVTDSEPDGDDAPYYDAVDALWGTPLDVDYGDIEPETPEGSFIREKAIAKRAVDSFEEYIKESDPRAYAYMLHRRNGGSDEEFLSTAKEDLPDLERLQESVDLQTRVYTRWLIEKGAGEDEANAVVQAAAKNGKLVERAEVAWNSWKQQEANYLKDIQDKNNEDEVTFRRSVAEFSESLKKAITNPEGNLQIPEAKKAEFMQHMKSLVKYDPETKVFSIVQEIDPKNLGKLIDKEFLGFTKGGLKDLVEKQAGVQVVKRLKAKVQQGDARKRPSTVASVDDTFLALGDL